MLLLDSRQRESERERIIKKERIACHFPLIDVSNYIIFSPLGETGICFCISIIISHSKACRQPISWCIWFLFFPSLLCSLSLPKWKKKKKRFTIMMDHKVHPAEKLVKLGKKGQKLQHLRRFYQFSLKLTNSCRF